MTSQGEGKCYRLLSNKWKNWADSKKECENRGYTLYVPRDTTAEDLFVRRTILQSMTKNIFFYRARRLRTYGQVFINLVQLLSLLIWRTKIFHTSTGLEINLITISTTERTTKKINICNLRPKLARKKLQHKKTLIVT